MRRRGQRIFAGTLLLLSVLTWALAGHAAIRRFAVVVGNNQGAPEDVTLRYAEEDSRKVAQVLRDVGGFKPADIVVLNNEDAGTFRSTLISINERVRSASALPDTQTVLFVYYSGHADANALRTANTRLPMMELAALVRGSAATFRLLVLDACRSGALTRVKGGRIVEPFPIQGDSQRLEGEGMAFLTASSANEDAQESDEIRGSFFTHSLVSGLLGAADTNHDGSVVLTEAYQYAYESTLRASSRTYAGAQHPTFHYDFRGQGALVLSHVRNAKRASLGFPAGVDFLVLEETEEGAVAAEVGAADAARVLSLRPGRYFLRARGADVLYEGSLVLEAGLTASVNLSQLRRVEYARLVRKGGTERKLAHGPELAGQFRSQLPNASGPCIGGGLGYRVELSQVTLLPRLGVCRAQLSNQVLSAEVDELMAQLAAWHAWDFPAVSVGLGLGLGATATRQLFTTSGTAPTRWAIAPFLSVNSNLSADLGAGLLLSVDGGIESHLMRLEGLSGRGVEDSTHLALRTGLSVARLF